jgi:hypothetical protein
MSAQAPTYETNGARIIHTFTPDTGTALVLEETSSTPPPINRDEDVDTTTTRTGNLRTVAMGERAKIGDAQFTVTLRPEHLPTLITMSSTKVTGTLVITYDSGKTNTYPNSFIKSYAPGATSIGGMPTATITYGNLGLAAPTAGTAGS